MAGHPGVFFHCLRPLLFIVSLIFILWFCFFSLAAHLKQIFARNHDSLADSREKLLASSTEFLLSVSWSSCKSSSITLLCSIASLAAISLKLSAYWSEIHQIIVKVLFVYLLINLLRWNHNNSTYVINIVFTITIKALPLWKVSNSTIISMWFSGFET